MFHGHLDSLQKPPLGSRPNTKSGDYGTRNVHNRWFVLFYHVWGPAWIEIYWNSIWLRAWSHMTSHYTWKPVSTLHDFGGVLGRPLDTFFRALTISWSRVLAHVRSGPYIAYCEDQISREGFIAHLFYNFKWSAVNGERMGPGHEFYTRVSWRIDEPSTKSWYISNILLQHRFTHFYLL